MKVRTRFAPSPTGALHAGTIRTALFAWLTARAAGGEFILRIEDTDQSREVAGASQNIIDSLKYLGIEWSEGPDIGGPVGPYRQSERLAIYKQWGQQLADSGLAYADPSTPAQLETMRQAAKDQKRPFLFRQHRPVSPPKWDGSQPLRLLSTPKDYHWHDLVMGDLSAGAEAIDDFILIKSDGFPTYNFCHIIDDHLMGISHVIRSQEFISSMPKFLNLYEALGIEKPIFATVPNVLGADGKRKLSKREGALPILEYRDRGILTEAMTSFLTGLGWNDGTTQEIYSLKDLTKSFTLAKVQRSGARFDEQHLLWVNGTFIRQLKLDKLYDLSLSYWPANAANQTRQYKLQVLGLIQERLKYMAEIPELTAFFFDDLPVDDSLIANHKQLKKIDSPELKALLREAYDNLSASDFSAPDLTNRLNDLLASTGQKPAVLFSLIRIATTQSPASPGLAETMHVLGREVSLSRIEQQIGAFLV